LARIAAGGVAGTFTKTGTAGTPGPAGSTGGQQEIASSMAEGPLSEGTP